MQMKSGPKVTHSDNNIVYGWDHIPASKYENWLKMTSPKIREDFSVDGYPFSIQIETTNFCNLRCPSCPAGGLGFNRSKCHMRLEEFKAIIDDMESYLLCIVLWDWGEPLLNPDLPEMIAYAAERDIRTAVSTNCNTASFHDGAYMERLLRSGLSTLILAIDSLDQKNYGAYRKEGNLINVLDGVEKAVSLKKRLCSDTLLVWRTVLMRQNEHELRALRNFARKIGADRFSAKTMNAWDELYDKDVIPLNPDYRRHQYKKGGWERIRVPFDCNVILRRSTIHSNGDVVPCCWYYDDDVTAGNVFTDGGFTKIWNGPSYLEMRRKILLEKDSMPVCSTCSFNFKMSRTGWFLQTVDLNMSARDRYSYLFKRYIELHMNPGILNKIIGLRDRALSPFKGS